MEIVTKENIQSILSAGESTTVEFKAGVRNARYILPRIISAFANTEGGIIIIGYNERTQSVIDISPESLGIVNRVIQEYELEQICDVYTVTCDGKTLIIVQVRKSESTIFAGGGAYTRDNNQNTVMDIKNVLSRIETAEESSNANSTKVLIEWTEQIYKELQRSQKRLDEEIKIQSKNMEIERKKSWKRELLFCILSAVIGYLLGKLF